ncbi:MAG: NUDIX hydrolase [Actinobacteria bacterium]|nr:NUDIX hydrolase [Actinomycetota bacterium]
MTADAAFSDAARWYTGLPTMYGSAAALITDPAGRVLLVKPNYRDYWSLPGGIMEHGEPPHEACAREVAEEVAIPITPGPLLVVDWAPPAGERPRSVVSFVFDGGILPDPGVIRLQADELDAFRLVSPGEEAARYLPPFLLDRVQAAVDARGRGQAVYLPAADQAG